MTTRLEKSVLLPLSPEDDAMLTRMLGRAVEQGYTITESEETTNGWTWRTFVFEREEPPTHISQPIGRVFAAGIVQYGTAHRPAA